MLMYLGSGRALAAYLRAQRAEALDECAVACGTVVRHLGEPSVRAAAIDCQEVCSLTADLLTRSGPLAGYAAAVCADAIRRCREACESLSANAAAAACAEACRRAEGICRDWLDVLVA